MWLTYDVRCFRSCRADGGRGRIEGKENLCQRRFEVKGAFARDYGEYLERAERKQMVRQCGCYRGGEGAIFFVDQFARVSLFVAEAGWRFERLQFHMYDPPNKALEPTLTIRPFSITIATLESPSVLWVSAAHL